MKSQSKSRFSLLIVGVLNGFLPCGLVYMAIVGAIATGTMGQGAGYMVIFGLGTIPLMVATALIGNFMGFQWRRTIQRLIPVFLVGFAILLIMRGMNLGIPFISPELMQSSSDINDIPMCH